MLVPAHDEQQLIARAVASISEQDYPHSLFQIVVIADNCTDSTARVATDAGAEVLERDDPSASGKGRALRWAMDRLLVMDNPPDAFVVVDADSIVAPSFLAALVQAWRASSSGAVQAEYLVLPEESGTRAELRAAAFLLFHRVRFSGRAALGLPCSLVGNGMLLSRELVEAHPWGAFTGAEDLEYSTDLRLAGVRPVFAPSARVWGPVWSSGRGARTQRLRWEGGRWHVARSRLPRLLRDMAVERRWSLWDVTVDLAVPPLGVLTVVVAAGSALTAALGAVGVIPRWSVAPWMTAACALPAHVLLGLRAAEAPASTYRALLTAPRHIAAETLTRLRILRGVDPRLWERTMRPGE